MENLAEDQVPMSDNTLTVIEIPNGDDFDGVWSQAEADEVSDAVDVLRKWGGREIVLKLWGCVQYDGFNIVMDDKKWDVALYTLEVVEPGYFSGMRIFVTEPGDD